MVSSFCDCAETPYVRLMGIPEGIMNERSVPFTCVGEGILLVRPAGRGKGGEGTNIQQVSAQIGNGPSPDRHICYMMSSRFPNYFFSCPLFFSSDAPFIGMRCSRSGVSNGGQNLTGSVMRELFHRLKFFFCPILTNDVEAFYEKRDDRFRAEALQYVLT